MTPSGGSTILFQLAATSYAVKTEPSSNLTSSRIGNAKVRPPSAGSGTSVQTSQTKSVVEAGFSGLTRISTL